MAPVDSSWFHRSHSRAFKSNIPLPPPFNPHCSQSSIMDNDAKSPEVPEAPKAPEAHQAPKATETPEAPEASSSSKAEEPNEAPKSDLPQSSKLSTNRPHPETPQSPKKMILPPTASNVQNSSSKQSFSSKMEACAMHLYKRNKSFYDRRG
ncbi:hypothetical protein BDD12DRAFT_70951 [Trichophaea hybrida]|nr:hypothetical protein BDD12DRAFT_70951 [Trichophaea hybrida]